MASVIREREEEEEEEEALTIVSSFPNTIQWFNNDDFLPDVDFIIPGVEKPLHLHSVVLIQASESLASLVKAKINAHGRFDPEAHRVEWMFDKSATDEKYRRCLVKWLRYCFGEDQAFGADELSAALATLLQLKLKCQEEVKVLIEAHMKQVASENVRIGCHMLIDCALTYEEDFGNSMDVIDSLAEAVLCRDNMVEHPDIAIDECLLLLPPRFLDVAQYGGCHGETGEFSVRMRYVATHDSALSIEEKREILSHFKAENLGSEEIKRLGDSGILEPSSLMDLCVRALQFQEKRSSEQERVFRLSTVEGTTSFSSDIPTGHVDASAAGAIYDSERNIIVSISWKSHNCRDVFVTHLDNKTTEVKRMLVPFDCTSHAPVYDGSGYVYFMEKSYSDGRGTRFGRINLASFAFEELPRFHDSLFAPTFSGCFHDGNVYVIDCYASLHCYDVSKKEWRRCNITVPVSDEENICVRLLSDPQGKGRYIYLMVDGDKNGLYCIDFEACIVNCLSVPSPGYDMLRDALLVEVESEEFIVIASCKNGAWYRFWSKSQKWLPLDGWKPFKGQYNHNYLVFSPRTLSFYYHIDEHDRWEVVRI